MSFNRIKLRSELRRAFEELKNDGDPNIIAGRVADAIEDFIKSATITDGDGKPCHVY